MRFAPVLAVSVVAACSGPRTDVYITIDRDALAVAHLAGGRVVDSEGEVAVVDIDTSGLDLVSEQMHATFHRCGGFAIHDSLDDAEAALHVQRPAERGDYTLDRGDAVRAILPQLDRERIRATIGELQAMPTRYYRSDDGARASLWLRDRWRSFTHRRDITIDLVDHGYPQKSVVLTIPGTVHPDEIVVIGGHLDSIAQGGLGKRAPGADDDASGIATETEVLRILLAADIHPQRTIQFMAYAAEEVGLRGSISIARDYQKRHIDVVGALQLDMTNYKGSDTDIFLINDFTSAAQNAFVVQLIEAYVGATWTFDKCGYACSDHAAWYRTGVPASMPFEAAFGDMNRNIHTRKDTLETSNNNADHAIKFARLAAAYAIELAKADFGVATAMR